MPNSRAKGARGEREAAAFIRERGYEARRGRQFSGGTDSPDVVHSIAGVHLEVKRVERGQLYDWLEQAKRDAGDRVPVVMHKRNRQDWVAILPMADLLSLLARVI